METWKWPGDIPFISESLPCPYHQLHVCTNARDRSVTLFNTRVCKHCDTKPSPAPNDSWGRRWCCITKLRIFRERPRQQPSASRPPARTHRCLLPTPRPTARPTAPPMSSPSPTLVNTPLSFHAHARPPVRPRHWAARKPSGAHAPPALQDACTYAPRC